MITLLFVQERTFIGKLIRLFTDFRSTVKGEFVPSHVALVTPASRRSDPLFINIPKKCGVIEMMGAPYGLVKSTMGSWLARNKGKRGYVAEIAVSCPFGMSGSKTMYDMFDIATNDGKWIPYEKMSDFAKMAIDRNPDNTTTMTCSEYVARVINTITYGQFEDPENTTPLDIFKWARRWNDGSDPVYPISMLYGK